MRLRFEFKLEDFWIGAFWRVQNVAAGRKFIDVWICFVPCFPLHIELERFDR